MGLFRPYEAKAPAEPTPGEAVGTAGSSAGSRTPAKPTAGDTAAAASAPAAAAPTKVSPPTGRTVAPASTTPATTPASTRTIVAAPTGSRAPQKKATPTPTRKQAEAARQARFNPTLTKKEQRRRDREARNKAQAESFKRINEQPVMTLIRDFVDCRWSLAEFAMPVMLLMLLIWVFANSLQGSPIQLFGIIAVYAVFVGVVLDVAVMWFGCRKQIRAHFPHESLKGKFAYAMNRIMMMRRSRRPEPAVKRGSRFAWPRQH